jgi:hypothetical protein
MIVPRIPKSNQVAGLPPIGKAIKSTRQGILALAVLLAASHPAGAADAGIHAYHTHIDSGETFEKFSRTGDVADIVVKLGVPDGRLVFWRGSSYLPYWETARGKWFLDEIIARHGDGEGRQPDRVNAFSRVALVENSAERVLVSWRYLPEFKPGNPYQEIDPTRFVEEQIEVLPDGKVTRVIRQGTARMDDWTDPLNRTTQVLQLAAAGVRQLSRTEARHSPPPEPVAGNPLRGDPVVRPVREWRFDAAAGDHAAESLSGEACAIASPKTLWRKGVSGACLQFDGYNTRVSLPAAKAPAISTDLTLEAWCAIGAYPWNWCPLVQQGDDDGYFLGVDGHGHPGFKLKVGDTWQELAGTGTLERSSWHHLVGTYDHGSGMMSLFVEGKLVASESAGTGGIQTTADPVQIGQGMPRRPVDPVRATTFIASYAFDGLIDEVRIYDRALKPEQVAASYRKFRPAAELAQAPDMDRRALPAIDTEGRFGAHYTRLKYYDVWDNQWRVGPYADVVVGFDQSPAKFVFWRGVSNIPMLVNEKGQWYSNEFNETWGTSGGEGCQEPISDKESFFNHARVIENTPARVVVHWRFPLVDVHHTIANYHPETGWGDWADWYFTIYPDGVAVKRMHLWTDGKRNHEWQESMAILGPNQHPEQVLETDPALILADLDGKATPYSWKKGPPKVDYRNQKIHIVNYRAQYDPFTIGDFVGGNVYSGERNPYSVFPTWNHWPVSQIPSDGRYASFPDRAACSSLTHVYLPDYQAQDGDRPFQEKLLMEGMSNASAKDLAPLAKSWLQAPTAEPLADCGDAAYDPAQRAYVLRATGTSPSIQIPASAEHPIVNPCLVVHNWNSGDLATLEVNSQPRNGGPGFRQGVTRDSNGIEVLVVWLQFEAAAPTTFTLHGAKPGPAAAR